MALKSSNKSEEQNNVYELTVTVEPAVFSDACTKAYLKQRKSIQLPGFRKGKAPQAMVERHYGEAVFYEDALEIVYPEAVTSAIEEAGLRVVGQPFDLDVPVMSKKDGVEMSMKVYVYPEVEVGEYKGLEAEKKPEEATDEDVENELKNMQERNSRLVTVEDRPAEMGDTCTIDFEGFVDDKAFEGGKGEKYPLELGSGSFIPGFEEQIAGKNIGDEFDVNVKFPEEYTPELAGKDAVFKVKLHEIKKKELPELDDEFAKDADFDTLDELKADIRKNISERKAEESKRDYEDQLLQKLVDSMQADIPEVMFTEKTDELVRDYANRLQMQGIDLQTYLSYLGQDMEKFRENFKTAAEKQVKTALALEKVAALENFEVTDEEVDEEVNRLAEQYKMEAEQIKNAVPKEQLIEDLKLKKAIDLIVASAVEKKAE